MLSKPLPLEKMMDGSAVMHAEIRAHLDGMEFESGHRADLTAIFLLTSHFE